MEPASREHRIADVPPGDVPRDPVLSGPEVPGASLRRARIGWAIILVVSALFTALTIRVSMERGRLAIPPGFDDVYYMAQGARWLAMLRDSGIGATLREYIVRPPHSPVTVGLAALSFGIAGIREWAPYAANAAVVTLYLGAAFWALRGAGLWRRLLGVALMATAPVTAIAVHDFRPDAAAAMLEALGVMLVLAGPVTGAGRRLTLAGAAFGASLLCKSSVFAATLIVAGATLGLAALAQWAGERTRPALPALARSAGLFLLGFVPLLLLYPPAGWLHQWEYFRSNIAGPTAQYWVGTESLRTHLLWYIHGPGGDFILGWHAYVFGVMLVIGAAYLSLLGRRPERMRGAALGALLILTFLMVSLNRMKSHFLGMPFQALAILAAFSSLGFMLRDEAARRRRVPWATGGLVVYTLVGACWFHWPFRIVDPADPAIAERRRLVEAVFAAARDAAGGRPARLYITSVGLINPDLMNLYAIREGAPLEFYGDQYAGTMEAFDARLVDADIVIASEPGMPPAIVIERYGTAAAFPYVGIQAQTIALLEHGGDFEPAGAIPVADDKSFLLFRRRAPFAGWEEVSGLKPAEGPYPQWRLQMVRWGVAPGTRLRLEVAGPMTLAAVARTTEPGQVVTVRLDGVEVKRIPMKAGPWQTLRADLDAGPDGGTHELELSYAAAAATGTHNAVLYRSLVVVPAR
jgi:hypothetical protein